MKKRKLRVGIILASHTREPSNFSLSLLKKAVKLLGYAIAFRMFLEVSLIDVDYDLRHGILSLAAFLPSTQK